MRAMIGVGMPVDQPLIVVHADGKRRCAWATEAHPDWVAYHDLEWGTPTQDPARLFETLTLTIFESGLSWAAIFARRTQLRQAFRSYDLRAVAAMTPVDIAELMADRTIIRNRRKIEATVHNACCAVSEPSLSDIVWQHKSPLRRPIRTLSEGRASSPESQQLCRALKNEGYRLVGPVVAHAFTLAVGVDNGHFAGCFRAAK